MSFRAAFKYKLKRSFSKKLQRQSGFQFCKREYFFSSYFLEKSPSGLISNSLSRNGLIFFLISWAAIWSEGAITKVTFLLLKSIKVGTHSVEMALKHFHRIAGKNIKTKISPTQEQDYFLSRAYKQKRS